MIVAYAPNIFDRSRFGDRVRFVETPAEAAGLGPDVIFVDLDRCQDPAGFRLDGAEVIGFGPHVESEQHDRARLLGYDEVLPRSLFFRRLPDLLAEIQT